MNKTKYLMGVALLIAALASSAFAELIDFRDSAWSGAAGLQSYTLDGVTVTCDNPYVVETDFLYWDAVDGFGVTSPEDSTDPDGMREADEKDDGETFVITFDTPTYVYGVRLADLYQYSDPGTGGEWVSWPAPDPPESWFTPHDGSGEAAGEGGHVTLYADHYDGTWLDEVDFWGQNSEQVNGEQYVHIGMTVGALSFGNVCTNSEYSIIGVDVVPLPGAVFLGFLGLGFAGMRLRRMVA